MDFKSIQSLGELTNRVIEIDQQLAVVHNIAVRSLEENEAKIFINLGFCSKNDVSNSIDQYLIELFSRNINPKEPKSAIQDICKTLSPFILSGKPIIFFLEGLKDALKQEQEDLAELIRVKTGTL